LVINPFGASTLSAAQDVSGDQHCVSSIVFISLNEFSTRLESAMDRVLALPQKPLAGRAKPVLVYGILYPLLLKVLSLCL
jgi:hypothetical protein